MYQEMQNHGQEPRREGATTTTTPVAGPNSMVNDQRTDHGNGSQSGHHHHQQQQHQSLPSMSLQCSPIFVEYQLMKEFILFQRKSILNVYVSPSKASAFDWFGVLFVHTGIYCGWIVRFTMKISTNYPNCDAPTVIFSPVPYHPLVSPENGHLDLSRQFPAWNSTCNFLFEVLQYIKTIFQVQTSQDWAKLVHGIDAPPPSPGNTEEDDFESIRQRVHSEMEPFNQQSIDFHHPDPHFIHFNHEEAQQDYVCQVRDRLCSDVVSGGGGGNGDLSMLNNKNHHHHAPTGVYYPFGPAFPQHGSNGSNHQFHHLQQPPQQQQLYHPNNHGSSLINGLSWTKKIIGTGRNLGE